MDCGCNESIDCDGSIAMDQFQWIACDGSMDWLQWIDCDEWIESIAMKWWIENAIDWLDWSIDCNGLIYWIFNWL